MGDHPDPLDPLRRAWRFAGRVIGRFLANKGLLLGAQVIAELETDRPG